MQNAIAYNRWLRKQSLRYCLAVSMFILMGCGSGSGGGGQQQVLPDTETPVVSGLQRRPVNNFCRAGNFVRHDDATDGGREGSARSSGIELTPITPQLNFSSPLLMLPQPQQTGIFYVVQQRGKVWRVDTVNETRSELVDLSTAYDLSTCGECGLLGMALHPDFTNNGHIYFSFTENVANTMVSTIGRFETPDHGRTLSQSPDGSLQREDILTVEQPFSNHNGGHIAFGPDDLLYVGLGDGGSGNDPLHNAQDVSTLLGAMLRLNVDGSPAEGNPAAAINEPGLLPEMYAWGLRNPWRFSFDRKTGDLWAGDVGQNRYEEVNLITAGGNYGWRCREGLHSTNNDCSMQGPFVDPVAEYGRLEGRSITGGYVYRGGKIPELTGKYLFADFVSGTVWTLTKKANGIYEREILLESGLNIVSFGEDLAGELYLVSFSGTYRLDPAHVPDEQMPEPVVPFMLSATGCANPDNPAEPVTGQIPYTLNQPFWADGAEKSRYLAVPDNTRIRIATDGDFLFPAGTVLRKDFHFNGRTIETRFFAKDLNERWSGYSYQWNDAQTDAELVEGGLDADILGADNQMQRWHFPAGSECLQCHTAAAGFSLGLEAQQLNRELTYPSTGTKANQLVTFNAVGLLDGYTENLLTTKLPSSQLLNESLEDQARSYLHSNCAGCHRPGGTSQSNMDLRFSAPLAAANICNAEPQNGDLGVADAKLLAPGDPDRSLLVHRMLISDNSAMPPLSRNLNDTVGADLIARWIDSISRCVE